MLKKIIFILIFTTCVMQFGSVRIQAQEASEEPEEISYTLISSDEISHVNKLLRKGIGQLSTNLKETYHEYNSPKAKEYIEKFDIEFLPFVVYDNTIAASNIFFHMVRSNMIEKNNGYYIIPKKQLRIGEVMLINRERAPNSLWIYGMGFCPYSRSAAVDIVDFIRQNELDIKLKFKYLIRYSEFGLSSPHGPEEIRENVRQIIIQKYYPDKFFDYLTLTQKKKPEEALKELAILAADIDSKKQEAVNILKAEYEEAEALGIRESPTFLLENVFLIPTYQGLGNHEPFNVKKN